MYHTVVTTCASLAEFRDRFINVGAACRISTYKIRILHSPEHTRTGKQHSRWKQRFDVCSKLQAYYNAALDFQFTLYIRLYLCTFCIA